MFKGKSAAALMLAGGIAAASSTAHATAFQQCPATAFLVQNNVAKLYGVDVSTGYVELLADNIATNSKVNGLGFNHADAHLYGWSYEHRTVARIGSDYTVQPIPLNQPLDDNYFVGDVTVDGSAYYVYKKGNGGSHGLWRIDLNADSPDHLTPRRIIDGRELSLSIFDFAFHPNNGKLYSVTNRGDLVSIDPDTGSHSTLTTLSERGTFGAVYFDVDGNLYISRNTDGSIFRIAVDSANPTAVWYSQGPKSGNNDGARCALAPVTPSAQSQIDFGDAPDSYGTTLDNNGARHNLEGSTVFLGNSVDAEPQAWLAPNSDDASTQDDEDGVDFITDIAAGETALVALRTQGSGYLNAWIDFDRDGSFDDDEQVVAGHPVDGGSEVIAIEVPQGIGTGPTWTRWRVSGDRLIGPTGGVSSGEVEDHQVDLFGRRVTTSHYPGADSYVTLAYEDLWPEVGDYDMNDVVLYYRTTLNTVGYDNRPDERAIHSLRISGSIRAVGASLRSGFGVETTGIPRSAIDESAVTLTINGEEVQSDVLEAGAGYEDAVFIVFDDVHNYVSSTEGCRFYRTEDYCGGDALRSHFTLDIYLSGDVSPEVLSDLILNPFIFGSDARRKEVHLKDRKPTAKADLSALGTGADASFPGVNRYYQTITGLPWAMVIGAEWTHPEESHDILQAYPMFGPYVISGGLLNRDWHSVDNAAYSRLYQEQ